MKIDNKLVHLSNTQIDNLIERYYNGEKVKSLIEEYNIDTNSNQLFRLFPPAITEETCPYCGCSLVITYKSKYYNNRNNPASCPECSHIDDEYCQCSNCKEKERMKIQKRRLEKEEILYSLLHSETDNKIDLDTLTFEEKIYLGAFLREGISEDFSYIKPVDDFIDPLAPTREYSNEIIEFLREKNIIYVHADSDIECFEDFNIETDKLIYDSFKVKWELNIQKEGMDTLTLIDALINPNYEIESEDAYQIWKKISLHESLEYLHYNVFNVFRIIYKAGEKTISTLNDLLNEYSVSQIYTVFYRSTNQALRFHIEHGASKIHASNTIVGNAQKFAERAKVNQWNVQRYHRLNELPESALSKFFFNRILKIGYAGFDNKPIPFKDKSELIEF